MLDLRYLREEREKLERALKTGDTLWIYWRNWML
jgi:hypothetical protein